MAVLAKQFFSHVFYFLHFQINSKVIFFRIKGILACTPDLSTSLFLFLSAWEAQMHDLCFPSYKTYLRQVSKPNGNSALQRRNNVTHLN